jgi:hypothetical protein
VDGDRAVVRLGMTLGVVDLAGPGAPRLVARSGQLLDGIQALAAAGGYVYAGSGNTLLTFRFQPGAGLVPTASLDTNSAVSRLVLHRQRLVMHTNQLLTVLDLSAPAEPVFRSRISAVSLSVGGLALTDDWLFVLSPQSKVHALSLPAEGPPGAVVEITPRAIEFGRPGRIVAWDHYVFVENATVPNDLGGVILDATVPDIDKTVARIDFGDWSMSAIGIDGQRLYLDLSRGAQPGPGEEQLVALDVADARRPAVAGQVPVPWPVTGPPSVTALGAGRLLRQQAGRLDVYQLDLPARPRRTGSLRWRAWGELLAVDGRLGYLGGACATLTAASCLHVVDLQAADLNRPTGELELPAAVQGLAVARPWAYATIPGELGSDLLVIDVSDATRPRTVADCPLGTGRRLAVSAQHLAAYDFVAPTGMALAQERPGVELFRRDGGACPVPLAALVSATVNSARMRGGYLFAALHLDGIEVFNLADPEAPRRAGFDHPLRLGATPRTDYFDLALDGRAAVVAAGDRGLMLVDLRQPTAPTALTFHADWCQAEHVVARDGLALAGCRDGTALVDISDPAAPRTLTRGTLPGTVAAGEGGRFYIADASHDVWELRATRRPLEASP